MPAQPTMLAIDRHRWLLEELNERGSLRTSEVAQQAGVAEETVRRDWEKLEADGMLLRTHGGAVRLEVDRREFPARERAVQNIAQKRRIARAAAQRLQPGQTVYFDASTTVLELVRILPEIPLTVVTNSIENAIVLADKSEVTCVLVGGSMHPSSLSCTGWAAEKALEIYHLDAAYLSCRGIDPARGFSDATEGQAQLKNAVVARSSEVVLLADHSKCGVTSSYFFAQGADVDLWLTDAAPPPQVREGIAAQGTRIEVAAE
ncbi:MAG: DeoR/GlpR transcriptional regulator [Chthoniobacterales bacterium]|nr:DeoR/GlpR transcriptional regulator [Chthoniobacterales bacterium]